MGDQGFLDCLIQIARIWMRFAIENFYDQTGCSSSGGSKSSCIVADQEGRRRRNAPVSASVNYRLHIATVLRGQKSQFHQLEIIESGASQGNRHSLLGRAVI